MDIKKEIRDNLNKHDRVSKSRTDAYRSKLLNDAKALSGSESERMIQRAKNLTPLSYNTMQVAFEEVVCK